MDDRMLWQLVAPISSTGEELRLDEATIHQYSYISHSQTLARVGQHETN